MMRDRESNRDISAIRQEYTLKTLSENDVAEDAVAQFQKWFDEAVNSEVDEPNAMSLATVASDQFPHVRIVLLKEISNGKFRFFTNYDSQKGKDIDANPRVSLMFFWPELERQVRINGFASKIPAEDSDQYFHSRPKGSQIGAHASPQSQVIPDRELLEKAEKELNEYYNGRIIPRPDHWGGYEVEPTTVEFWQGRKSRLHDRIRYTVDGTSWKIDRLAP